MFGWIVLLAITFAVNTKHTAAINSAGFPAIAIIETALSLGWAKAVILISTVGQLFCGMALRDERLADDVRVLARRRRPRAQRSGAGSAPAQTPTWAVLFVVVFALIVTIPAYFPNTAGYPVAFFAVTSISVIGLYIAYTIPVFLRWRMGDRFEPGPWTLGQASTSGSTWSRSSGSRSAWSSSACRRRPAGVPWRQRLQLVVGQLRAARDDRRDARRHDLVRRLGAQDVQGPDPHDRRSERRVADPAAAAAPAVA